MAIKYVIEYSSVNGTVETFCDNYHDFEQNLFADVEREVRRGATEIRVTIAGDKK